MTPTPTQSDAGPTKTLAAFAVGVDVETMPAPVRHQAERLLLDTVGCILGGASAEAGRASHEWARRSSTGDSATVIGFGLRTSRLMAAYANGRLAAVLDADETYPGARQVSHLASATVAAALAVAEDRGGDGRTLLSAIVAGYEVGARVSNAMIPDPATGSGGLRAGWGPGSVLGATAAAARAMGLDPPAAAHALGIAGLHIDPPPLKWTEVRPAPMTKSADAGWHALTAIAAAEQAELGMTGYDTILDGQTGLWRALGYAAGDEAALTERLRERWIIEDAAFKRWPCQYWMHQALTALRQVLDEHRIRPGEVERIVLATNEKSLSPKFHDPEPPGEIDRAFSLPHAAAMLVRGVPPGPPWVDERIAAEAETRRLRQLVRVELHPDAARFAEWIVDHQIRDLPAGATVHARGRAFSAEVRFGLGSPWSAATRLSDPDLATKFREMALPDHADDPGWARRAGEAIDMLLDAGQARDVRSLVGRIAHFRPPDSTERR